MASFAWFGAGIRRFGATTDLGTAANWSSVNPLPSVPTASDALFFNAGVGAITTLSGTATGLNASFSGVSNWVLQGATLTLAGAPAALVALQDSGKLTVNGGTLVAGGSSDIDLPRVRR